ncbi:hypothetical protein [Gynuella sp.]
MWHLPELIYRQRDIRDDIVRHGNVQGGLTHLFRLNTNLNVMCFQL